MNLIVSHRPEAEHLRFDVRGAWHYNDALALAYHVKAAGTRERVSNVLIDLRNVTAADEVEGKFLVCDRLRRVLPGRFNVAMLAPVELVDLQERHMPGEASVVLFSTERAALHWLDGVFAAIKHPLAIKNPPVSMRAEG